MFKLCSADEVPFKWITRRGAEVNTENQSCQNRRCMWGFRVVVLHRKTRNCSKVRAARLYFLFPSRNMVNGWVVAGDVVDAESPCLVNPVVGMTSPMDVKAVYHLKHEAFS